MKANQQRYYIVYLTPQDYQTGLAYTHTPQHLTLVPPLLIDPLVMTDAIKAVANKTSSFPITVASEGQINPNFDTEVYFVEPVEPIRELHLAFLEKLKEQSVDLSHSNWIGREFIPHIAKRKRLSGLTIGQELMFDNIAVIEKNGNFKTIIKIEKLQ